MSDPVKGPEPDIVRLAKLVKRCRDAQRRYFADRTEESLKLARSCEFEVDKAVAWVLTRRQPDLPGFTPPAGQGGAGTPETRPTDPRPRRRFGRG